MGLNLNLRQIIRNQKTKNFDLISLISEETPAEEAKKKDLESAGGGYWKDKDGNVVAKTVGDKLEPVSSDDDTKDTGAPPSDDEKETQVNINDEERSKINDFAAANGLKPSKDDKNVFVDPNGNDLMIIGADGDFTS